jgi:2-polyprenyl-3-methyl-5-hydroxy-6-metoxy-1,4-benzoquinol methylase
MDAPGTNREQQTTDPIAWELVPCPLCGASQQELLLNVTQATETYHLVRCQICGLGYQNPRPDLASIGRFYPRDYECYQAPESDEVGRWARLRLRAERMVLSRYYGNPPPITSWFEKLFAFVARLWVRPNHVALTAIPYVGEGRLLDFGCGSGWYAHRMRERGWTVSGMDFSKHAARKARTRFGIDVLVGTLPHPEVKPESYDVITMGQVLEHVHRPERVIEAAAKALRPGGYLVISVPNLDSWGFRFFGQDWWPLDLPRHLIHFTPATLRRFVEASGLEVMDLRLLGRTSWMCRSFNFAITRRKTWRVRLIPALFHLSRVLTSLLTRWTVWTGRADCILLMARRPATQPVHIQNQAA